MLNVVVIQAIFFILTIADANFFTILFLPFLPFCSVIPFYLFLLSHPFLLCHLIFYDEFLPKTLTTTSILLYLLLNWINQVFILRLREH